MSNEMIDALTRGIGVELGKPIRIAFFEKEKLFMKNAAFQQCTIWQKQLITDMAALSIFNQSVILPYHGASNFYSDSKKAGVTRVRVGSQHIDREFIGSSSKITRQFFAIISEYDIDINHLHISNISDFVNFWIERSRNYD
ncbi:hypothetical protein [Shewanella algae]|nr:hypothetical protein TUM4442_30950 [Shewanella algae]